MAGLFLLVENCLRMFNKLIATCNYLYLLSILVGNTSGMQYFINSVFENLIPSKIEFGQNFSLKIHVQMAISLSIFDRFQQMRAQNLS